MNLSDVNKAIRKCKLCEQARVCTDFGPIPGEGNPKAKVMIISSPSLDMISPTDGMNGIYLDHWFNKLKIDKNQIYITLSLKCAVTRNVTQKIKNTCANWALYEYELIKPKAVFVFGKPSKNVAEKLIKNGALVYYYEDSLHYLSSKKQTQACEDIFIKMKEFTNV